MGLGPEHLLQLGESHVTKVGGTVEGCAGLDGSRCSCLEGSVARPELVAVSDCE